MRAYRAGFAGGFWRTMANPEDLATRSGFVAIILLVQSSLWRSAIASQGGAIDGYTLPALLWYVFAAQTSVGALRPRMIEEVGDEIGSGAVAIAMLRPTSVAGLRMSIEYGEVCARMIWLILLGGIVMLLVIGAPPSWLALMLAVPAMLLASLANVAMQHAIGGVAFWLLDAKSGWFLFQKVVFLPGGMLIPLEMLPGAVGTVCKGLPFAAMAYIPGRLAAGNADVGLIVVQLMWVAILVPLALGVFALGERRLGAVGG